MNQHKSKFCLFRAFFCILISFLFAACGTFSTSTKNNPVIVESGKTSSESATKNKKGGYYKDDGPAENIPDNLDSLPDAEPQIEPLHRFANRPYVVFGKSYTPQTRVQTFSQKGIASWYGKKFHGQKTSTGEIYDMFKMSAAHPTLPLPSYARVTNPANGKSVVVRVNDRGPFHANRIMDLSYAAAKRLDYIHKGSAPVEVEMITSENMAQMKNVKRVEIAENAPQQPIFIERASAKTNVVAAPKQGIYLQLGAFSNQMNAENFKAHAARELEWIEESFDIAVKNGMYRVYIGPYVDRNASDKIAAKIVDQLGYKPTFTQR